MSSGEFRTCAYTIEGVRTDCAVAGAPGGRAVSVTHRFAAGGRQTVALHFDTAADPVDRSLTVEVEVLQPPRGVVVITGARHVAANDYVAVEGTPITLDASGTTGDYSDLYWQDTSLDAPRIHSTVWSPAWGVGSHSAILSIESQKLGAKWGDAFNIRIVAADTTPPTGAMPEPDLFGDPRGPVFTVDASDAESEITSIELHGLFNYACRPAGSDPDVLGTQAQRDATETPWYTARGPELIPTGPGAVSVTVPSDLCPAGQELGPRFQFSWWAVVRNGADLSVETPHNMVLT